jgi:hypothetical protein
MVRYMHHSFTDDRLQRLRVVNPAVHVGYVTVYHDHVEENPTTFEHSLLE